MSPPEFKTHRRVHWRVPEAILQAIVGYAATSLLPSLSLRFNSVKSARERIALAILSGRGKALGCTAVARSGQRLGAGRCGAVLTVDSDGDAIYLAEGGPQVEVTRANLDQCDLEAAIWVQS